MNPQKINIFLDDSGVFRSNQYEYFVYAGYVFIGDEARADAHRKYRSLSDSIRKSVGVMGELKATHLKGNKQKNTLATILKGYDSMACVVKVTSLQASIRQNKLSSYRYKDYALKVAIKRKLETLIVSGRINQNDPIELNIFIDEQHTATDGYYSLEESIREEFTNGIRNFNYGTFHPPLFQNQNVSIRVKFCDSSGNYLIQAADILANRLFTSFNYSNPWLRQLPNLDIYPFP